MAIRLTRQRDSLMADLGDGEQPVAVSLVYPRPVSAREREVSVMDVKRRKELAWLSSLDELDPDSRNLAEEELYRRYRIALVSRIPHSHVNHGHRYLRVETDRGERYFNLREPGKNVTRLSEDHIVIRDSMGNRYEIVSIAALDEDSRANLERVL